MRFSLILLGVVAASLFAVCNVSSAQNAKKATFDESLLEVQDGETVDYYKALLDDIQNSFNGVYNDFQEAVKDEKATDEQKKALQDDLAQLVG
ncbi:MAG: hypothetical protein HUK22_03370, partial [Thermoguttaceae bacterium]|nr:hypothetical protein [Thermoguttaceae bacterium]